MSHTQHIQVQGLSCVACVRRVERALTRLAGVRAASANLATGMVAVEHDPARAPLPELLRSIRQAGYRPALEECVLPVHGMSCAACVRRVERALGKVRGVVSAQANLLRECVHLEYLPSAVDTAILRQAIIAAGYEVPAEDEHARQDAWDGRHDNAGRRGEDDATTGLRRDLFLAVLFTLPLVLLVMGPMLSPAMADGLARMLPTDVRHWLEALLSTPVLFFAGARFFRQGWVELKHLNPGMNSLVMLGAGAAYGYSLVALLAPELFPPGTAHLYFEAAAVIVTLILLGRYLEANARQRTSEAIRKLAGLQSRTAWLLRDGTPREVPVESVRPGDLLLVRPGSRVPVDGDVVEGESHVDESMINGEPLPRAKTAGSELIGGTVNKHGSLVMRATRTGDNTVLSQIIRLVAEAQAGKPAIQRFADRIAAVFVPVVMALAAIVFLVWLIAGPQPALNYAFVAAVSVLLIACPCAMGLATPTAIMVSTGKAAELGILFRQGSIMEQLAQVDLIVMDKTGTLTQGRPEVAEFIAWHDDEDTLLSWIAAVEQASEHPIARTIVELVHERKPDLQESMAPVTDFQALPGKGVSGRVDGHHILIGTARFLAHKDIDLTPGTPHARRLAARGMTLAWCAVDGRLAALFAVSDPLKPGSKSAVQRLRTQDLEVTMITGDNRQTAEAVARQLGLPQDAIRAEVLPGHKADHVRRLQAAGRKVAFVGDGINDAPALAQADVGIAMGTGTDIAMESGDVILMSGNLHALADTIELARRSLGIIKGNFFWAYAYNVALIPVAAGALYPFTGLQLNPMLAAGAMSLSSLFVVSNSLRLRRFRGRRQSDNASSMESSHESGAGSTIPTAPGES